ncbi:MAG TPA: hypothetical protein VF487_01210 [Chitinophagaceae bacterium]
MTEPIYKGTVSFVNYEKNFATIEYEQGAKKKSVNCKTDALTTGRKPHYFRVGDEVSFMLKLSDRGDKMTGFNVKFLYNTALDVMIQKAAIENRFSGYLKKVEDSYFVKEWDSYIFFPLIISPWEKPPADTADNEAISFRLINLDKLNSIAAELFSHSYIPEYKKAVQHFNNRIIIEAEIYKITPHAIFLNLFDDKVQARLAITATEREKMKEGDIVPVLITHLTHTRIVVERVKEKAE